MFARNCKDRKFDSKQTIRQTCMVDSKAFMFLFQWRLWQRKEMGQYPICLLLGVKHIFQYNNHNATSSIIIWIYKIKISK